MIQSGRVAEVGNLIKETEDKSISELSTEGFFVMAYPHIFSNGLCDITIKSMVNIDYHSWVEHIIYYCGDNRVAAHRFLKFHLLNIGKGSESGSFCVNQQLNEKKTPHQR